MKKTLLLLTWLLTISIVALAQRQVKGKVTDEDGNPLGGVSVQISGTKSGTTTDASGNFSISAAGSGDITLLFSSSGYQPSSITTSGNETMSVKLQKEVTQLGEVVMIGYQTVKRRDLLASVSSISAKDLKDIPINSAAEALNGRLAGVTATTAEGSPDAVITIRVRGGMSITGDNSPLYIVDGVQVENALTTLSPQDIESIDVLKDAAATAIYGARGGNGVIIITTKSGRAGKPKVNYNGFVGVRWLANKLNVLDPYDYVFYQSERSRGSSTDSTNFVTNFGPWNQISQYKAVSPVDWQEEVMGNTGVSTSHNVSVGGGTKRVTYNFGYTFNNDNPIVINSKYTRHLFNIKTDFNVIRNLKVGIGGRYLNQDVIGAGVSDAKGSAYNRLRNAVKYRPFLSQGMEIDDADPIADPNVGNGLNLVNPIALANSEFRNKSTEAYNFTAYASYTILKNLTFRSTFGYDHNEYIDRQFNDSITPYSVIQGGRKPIAGLDTVMRKTITNSNVLTYTINGWKDKHDFSFMVGEETYELKTESHSQLFRDYPTFTSHETAFTNTSLGNSFTGYPKMGETRYTNLSFFGRINYTLLDKYLFSFNMRADGASKFAPGRQWGYFPAGSFAWRIKKEKFLENVNFIQDMKLRLGYGVVGNNRINDYLFLTTFRNDGAYYYGIDNNAVIAYYSGSLANEALRWESTENKNIGIDVSLFTGRLGFSLDVYNNQSKDLLLNVPIASTYGYSTQIQNVGKTSNKGVEIQLNSAILRKARGLNWNANFNISFNKNKVEGLGVGQDFFFPAASWGVSGQPTDYIHMIGQSVGSFWGLVTDGFYTLDDFDYSGGIYTLKPTVVTNVGIIGPVQPGSIKFKDLNGDGRIDINNDRTIIGDPTPKFTGGLHQEFKYRNWDASLFINFSYGNDIYNANKIEFTNGYANNANMLDIMTGRWKVVTETGQTAQWVSGSTVYGIAPDQLAILNEKASIWQPLKGAGAFYPHSWAMEDGSFLRFNNFTLGYSLPIQTIGGLKMTRLRFYFTANNFAIITNYSGYDPEVSVRTSPLTPGLDYSAYPKSRSFVFGLNASF